MLWNHPYAGPYAFAEWLLSIVFWLSVLVLAGAWMIAAYRRRRGVSTPRNDHS